MEYNGWKNKATWNVALYINNDYNLYQLACSYQRISGKEATYKGFFQYAGLKGATPDGVMWDCPTLCKTDLNELIQTMND